MGVYVTTRGELCTLTWRRMASAPVSVPSFNLGRPCWSNCAPPLKRRKSQDSVGRMGRVGNRIGAGRAPAPATAPPKNNVGRMQRPLMRTQAREISCPGLHYDETQAVVNPQMNLIKLFTDTGYVDLGEYCHEESASYAASQLALAVGLRCGAVR